MAAERRGMARHSRIVHALGSIMGTHGGTGMAAYARALKDRRGDDRSSGTTLGFSVQPEPEPELDDGGDDCSTLERTRPVVAALQCGEAAAAGAAAAMSQCGRPLAASRSADS